jgi:hypothetical protein
MSSRPRPFLAVLLAALALATTAAQAEPPATVFSPDPGTTSRRIVIVPVNLGVRAEPEVAPGIEPVWTEILNHFQSQDVPVVALERSSAQALWKEVMLEASGAGDANDVYEVYGLFARRIAEQVDCGAIVFPSLVTRVAKVSGRAASWDGARHVLEIPGRDLEEVDGIPEGGIKIVRHGVQGEIAAASLHVAIVSPQGELRFEGAGGLELLQRLVEGRNAEIERVARNDAWQDPEPLREGIGLAFRKPLPASKAH